LFAHARVIHKPQTPFVSAKTNYNHHFLISKLSLRNHYMLIAHYRSTSGLVGHCRHKTQQKWWCLVA